MGVEIKLHIFSETLETETPCALATDYIHKEFLETQQR